MLPFVLSDITLKHRSHRENFKAHKHSVFSETKPLDDFCNFFHLMGSWDGESAEGFGAGLWESGDPKRQS